MKRVDLHVHTTASDGTCPPSEVVFMARKLGLAAIAVTDHDTAAGVPAALAAGAECGLEVVPGIEVSVDWRSYGVHILGYFIDPAAPALTALLDWVVAERERRNGLIAAALRADGIPVDLADLERRFPGAVIGRPHFAAAIAELGLAENVKDAFDRYLSIGKKYFRPREYIPLQQGLDVIRAAGGRAVFAHPLQYRLEDDTLRDLTRTLTDAGAVGMECLYHGYTPEQVEHLRALAAEFGLLVTGGSDFHGTRKENRLGEPEVPYSLLQSLREART